MSTCISAVEEVSLQAAPSSVIKTTLYDLIAALSAEVAPEEEDHIVTAAAVHILNTHRVICAGPRHDRRIVADTTGYVAERQQAMANLPESCAALG